MFPVLLLVYNCVRAGYLDCLPSAQARFSHEILSLVPVGATGSLLLITNSSVMFYLCGFRCSSGLVARLVLYRYDCNNFLRTFSHLVA